MALLVRWGLPIAALVAAVAVAALFLVPERDPGKGTSRSDHPDRRAEDPVSGGSVNETEENAGEGSYEPPNETVGTFIRAVTRLEEDERNISIARDFLVGGSPRRWLQALPWILSREAPVEAAAFSFEVLADELEIRPSGMAHEIRAGRIPVRPDIAAVFEALPAGRGKEVAAWVLLNHRGDAEVDVFLDALAVSLRSRDVQVRWNAVNRIRKVPASWRDRVQERVGGLAEGLTPAQLGQLHGTISRWGRAESLELDGVLSGIEDAQGLADYLKVVRDAAFTEDQLRTIGKHLERVGGPAAGKEFAGLLASRAAAGGDWARARLFSLLEDPHPIIVRAAVHNMLTLGFSRTEYGRLLVLIERTEDPQRKKFLMRLRRAWETALEEREADL